ncbi:hypothetical protein [Pseudomonas kulmbachensis]|uniref:hypothetical protein n=1 Tax=Pseudomonas kulmbachensis TaxID=3043408 RepID=UPI002AB1F4E3|nr:hypothetical protein [Pseudomonas sp. V3/3/4/13]
MSDDQIQKSPKRSLFATKVSDFVRFLVAKTPETDCPVCNGSTWTVVCPFDDDADTYRLSTPLKDGNRPMAVSTFALYCDSCGYLRQHSSKVVSKWVADNPIEMELDFDSPPENTEADET